MADLWRGFMADLWRIYGGRIYGGFMAGGFMAQGGSMSLWSLWSKIKKGKICFVIYIAGFFFKFFYVMKCLRSKKKITLHTILLTLTLLNPPGGSPPPKLKLRDKEMRKGRWELISRSHSQTATYGMDLQELSTQMHQVTERDIRQTMRVIWAWSIINSKHV